MIVAIVGYLQKGKFPPEIFNNPSIALLINNGNEESEFLHNLLISRANALFFLQSQAGFVESRWLKGTGTKSYHVTYYMNQDAFNRCNQSYKLESSVSEYKYQKEEFLRKFELECVEYGFTEVEGYNLTFDQVESIVSGNRFTNWPADLSHLNS